MKHVFIIGGTTFDHIIHREKFPQPIPQTIHQVDFQESTGSTGSGKALSLTKLGISNTLYSVLGDDSYGHQIRKHLQQEGVELIIDIDPKGTERHFNIMDGHGRRISIFITQSSEFPVMNLDLIEKKIQQSDLLVLNIIAYCKQVIPLLRKTDKPIWTDLHDYNEGNPYHEPFIDISNYVFLSSDNLKDYRQTMQSLMNRGKELVVCTHGKKGATALTKQGEWIEVASCKGFALVDANGAGDNFFSGFLYAFLNGKSILDCMKYGTIAGATCITSSTLVSEKLSNKYIEELYREFFCK